MEEIKINKEGLELFVESFNQMTTQFKKDHPQYSKMCDLMSRILDRHITLLDGL